MTILMWDKPKKKLSKADWAENYGFEDGPKGGYVPNMSDDDSNRWKAKITGTKLGFPQVEVRKTAGDAQLLLIINLGDGYNYKSYRAMVDDHNSDYWRERNPFMLLALEGSTIGKALHISTNGGAVLSVEELAQLPLIIEEAKTALNEIVEHKGDRQAVGLWVDPTTKADTFTALGANVIENQIEAFEMVVLTAPEQVIAECAKVTGVKKVVPYNTLRKIIQAEWDRDYQLLNPLPGYYSQLAAL